MSQFQQTVTAQYNYFEDHYGSTTYILIGKKDSISRNGALRFTSVSVPKDATIDSATLSLTVEYRGGSNTDIKFQTYGIDEDNTSNFSTDPMGRSQTSAVTTTQGNIDNSRFDVDVKSQVQEIMARSGWSMNNAIGFIIRNYEAYTQNGIYFEDDIGGSVSCYLTINYQVSSPSASISPSSSSSKSASASASPSSSLSPSSSASPSPELPPEMVLLVAKSGIDALKVNDPTKFKFHSQKGTLKYFYKGSIDVTVNSNSIDLEIANKATYTHNLGYYPDVEVYMKTPGPGGVYIPVPANMAGASVLFSGTYVIGENDITFYATNSGYPSFSSNQTYTFLFFIFKNDLTL